VRVVYVAVVGGLLLAGCGSDSSTESESAGGEPSLLYVQDADGGTLDGDQLTMVEVSPNTGWFTDRPDREAGQIATADFVTLWDEGGTFSEDPPNADFTCQKDGDTVNVVVELTLAVVNGRTLTYDVVRIGDTPAGNFDCDGNAHLFIDNGNQCAEAQGGSRRLGGAYLEGCDLRSVDLAGADLVAAHLGGANLEGANLAGANLNYVRLNGANLNGANLNGAKLVSAELRFADLTAAVLTGTDLNGAILVSADLTAAVLDEAVLTLANLEEANLTAAVLTGAYLPYGILINANLTDANLTDANLTDAYLTDANLSKADLMGVIGWESIQGRNTIRGLDTAKNVPG
jgi:uncharacterized protein YjbI with pentapeptide repeats